MRLLFCLSAHSLALHARHLPAWERLEIVREWMCSKKPEVVFTFESWKSRLLRLRHSWQVRLLSWERIIQISLFLFAHQHLGSINTWIQLWLLFCGVKACSVREGLWQSEEEEKPTPCWILGLMRSKEVRQRELRGYPMSPLWAWVQRRRG